jgi:hypothetical protein
MIIVLDEVDTLISSMHESPVVLTSSLSKCYFFHDVHNQLNDNRLESFFHFSNIS